MLTIGLSNGVQLSALPTTYINFCGRLIARRGTTINTLLLAEVPACGRLCESAAIHLQQKACTVACMARCVATTWANYLSYSEQLGTTRADLLIAVLHLAW